MAYISANVTESRLLDQKAQELMTFITQELSKITGLAKTETFLTLKSYNKFA